MEQQQQQNEMQNAATLLLPFPFTVICSYRRHAPASVSASSNLGLSLLHFFWGRSLPCHPAAQPSHFKLCHELWWTSWEATTVSRPFACRTLFILKNVKFKARFRVGNALTAGQIWWLGWSNGNYEYISFIFRYFIKIKIIIGLL